MGVFDFLKPSSDETLPAVREVELSKSEYSVGKANPDWRYGEEDEEVIYPPYEDRKRLKGPVYSLETEREYYEPEDVIYGPPGASYEQSGEPRESKEFDPEDVDWERYEGKFRYGFDAEKEDTYEPFQGPSSEELRQDWKDKDKSKKFEEAVKRARELEDIEWRLEKAKGKAELGRLGATPFSKAKKILKETSKAAEFTRKAATLGGAIKLDEKNKKYYGAPAMSKLTDPTALQGARSLTSMQRTREAQSSGSNVGAPLRGQAKPNLSSLREASQPKGLKSATPERLGVLRQGIPGLERLRSPQRPTPVSMGASPIARLSKGQEPVSSASPIAMASTSVGSPQRGLSPLEVQVLEAAKRTPQADTRSSLIAEVATGGVSKGQAGSAIDSLVKKGALQKFSTHSGEPVLEVR